MERLTEYLLQANRGFIAYFVLFISGVFEFWMEGNLMCHGIEIKMKINVRVRRAFSFVLLSDLV